MQQKANSGRGIRRTVDSGPRTIPGAASADKEQTATPLALSIILNWLRKFTAAQK